VIKAAIGLCAFPVWHCPKVKRLTVSNLIDEGMGWATPSGPVEGSGGPRFIELESERTCERRGGVLAFEATQVQPGEHQQRPDGIRAIKAEAPGRRAEKGPWDGLSDRPDPASRPPPILAMAREEGWANPQTPMKGSRGLQAR